MTVFKRTLKIGKDIAIFAGLFVVIYTAVNYLRRPTPPAQMPSLTTITGDSISIDPSSPTLVYFWGTWCHICATTSPNVARLSDNGYNVITVAVASGDDDTLTQYLDKKGYHFSVINDDNGAIFAKFGGEVTPSFVILKDGKMTQGFTGITPYWLLKGRMWAAGLGWLKILGF